jgi:hypothetical protein
VGKFSPKRRERRKRRGVVDMSTTPPPEPPYKPPPLHACTELVFPIDLSDEDQFVIRQRIYKGKIVDFAIMQKVCVDGKWVDVARIDCCGGTIHRHQYVAGSDDDTYDHRLIAEIPAQDGWEVVDQGYDGATNVMFNEWEGNLRRWRDGS